MDANSAGCCARPSRLAFEENSTCKPDFSPCSCSAHRYAGPMQPNQAAITNNSGFVFKTTFPSQEQISSRLLDAIGALPASEVEAILPLAKRRLESSNKAASPVIASPKWRTFGHTTRPEPNGVYRLHIYVLRRLRSPHDRVTSPIANTTGALVPVDQAA